MPTTSVTNAGASRLAARPGQVLQKSVLGPLNNAAMDNFKRQVLSDVNTRQTRKTVAPPKFTVFDENAVDAAPVRAKEVAVKKNSQVQVLQDKTKAQRQPLQALKLPAKPRLEDSSCSSYMSLEQSGFVLQTGEYYEDKEVPVLSPMVLDTSVDTKGQKRSFESTSEYNQHLDSVLPECYKADIYKYLRDCEARHRPKPHYMNKQHDITQGMRSILIDWLVEVAEEYKLHNETLFLAVSFIDRFLSQMSVLRGKLQLVGTAAMFIASKYEEIYPPEVGEFVYITDDTYTKRQVLRMEQLILQVLAFELAVPTSNYFMQHFVQLTCSTEATLHLATYLCELTLMETEPFLNEQPSAVGAACVALSRLAHDVPAGDIWPSHVQQATGYSLRQLVPCIRHLHASWTQAPLNAQQAIREKYKSEKWHSVSLMTPPGLSLLDSAQF